MKATEILSAKKGRPVDLLESALQPDNMPIEVVSMFFEWTLQRIYDLTRRPKFVADSQNYLLDFLASEKSHTETSIGDLFRNARQLSLLAIEVRGFGGKGRRERKAQCRELLRLCRIHDKEWANRNEKKKAYQKD